MGRTTLTQAERAECGTINPIYLVDWTLESTTLHISDRPFVYRYGSTVVNYDDYLLSIDGLGEIVSVDNMIGNPSVVLTISNETWSTYDYLYQYSATTPFLRSEIAIYELRPIADDEVFASDVKVCKGKYCVEEVYEITHSEFKMRLSSRIYDKRNAWIGDRITRTIFPYADADDVGKVRNVLYGELEKVPCKCVKTGAIDTLVSNFGKMATTFVVSGVAQIPWIIPGTIQVDDEQMYATAYNETTYEFTVTRGYAGTQIAKHKAGGAVYQVRANYFYEIAKHPIKSIQNVFVDDVRQISYPDADYVCRAYTGQPGDELAGYEGTSVVVFTVNPVIKKQINVEVTSEHTHYTSQGSHYHSTTTESTVTRSAVSVASSGETDDPTLAVDGSASTYCVIHNTDLNPGFIWLSKDSSASLGTLIRVVVSLRIRTSGISNSTPFRIAYGGAYRVITSNYDTATDVSFSFGSTDWGGNIGVQFSTLDFPSDNYAWIRLFNINSITMYYTSAPTQSSPAAGVSTTISNSTYVAGLSSADIVIGDEVTVDCKGYKDTAIGKWTGSPNVVIEQPSQQIAHFACALLGFPEADLGASFTSTGAFYASEGYKSAFIAADLSEDAQDIFNKIAYNFRSIVTEWNGKLELYYLPETVPTPDIIFDEDDFAELPVFSKESTRDRPNNFTAYYRRNYRTRRAASSSKIYGLNSDAQASGYMDALVGSYGDGDVDKKLELKAIRSSTIAQNVLDFRVAEAQADPLFIKGILKWRAVNVAPGKTFQYVDRMAGDKTYLILEYKEQMEEGRVYISGREIVTL